MLDLNKDVKYIKGVGPARAELLNSIGIFNLYDLITYFPRDYEDRSKTKSIADLINGEEVLAAIEKNKSHVSTEALKAARSAARK